MLSFGMAAFYYQDSQSLIIGRCPQEAVSKQTLIAPTKKTASPKRGGGF
jgi:hypothetical protein